MAEHADGSIIIDAEITTEKFKNGSSEMQRAIKSLNNKMQSLGPTLQKAISGSESALSAFDAKATTLENTISKIEADIESLGNTRIPTEDYKNITSEAEKAQQALFKLYEKQDKMEATGVKQNSRAWQSLQYDIENAEENLTRFERKKANMESSGTAFKMGIGTEQYKQLESALDSAKAKLEEMRTTEEEIRAQQPFDNLMSDIESIDADADKFTNTLSRLKETNVSQNSSQWSNLAFSIQSALKQLSAYQEMLKSLHVTSVIDDSQFQQASEAIASARERMQDMSRETDKARGKLGLLGRAGKGLKSAFSHIGKAVNMMKSLRKQSGGCSSAIGKLGKKLTGLSSMMKRMITGKLISAMLTGVKDGINNLAQYSSQTNSDISALKSGLTQLKNSLATAFAPILTAVTPILATLINYLSSAITYVGKFIAALTGSKTFTKATAVQENYAASLGNTASAAEKAQKQLASFDELNVLSDSSSGKGSGGGGGVSPSEMFEEVPIESSITDFVNRLKDAFRKGNYAQIGRIIGNGINTALQKINDFISWDNVGGTVTKVVKGIAEGFNSLIYTVNWELLGDTVAQGLNTVLHTLYLVITEFDWPAVAAALARSLNGLVSGFDWDLLGTTLSTGVITALKSIRSAVKTFNWAELGSSVAEGINNIDWVGAFKQAAGALSDAVKGLLDLCIGFAENLDWGKLGTDLWNSIVAVVTEFDWAGVVSKAFRLLGNAIGGATKLLVEFARSFWKSLESAWESTKSYFTKYITDAGGNIIKGLWNGIVDAVKGVGTWIKEHIFNPFINGFKNAFGIHSPSTVMAKMGKYVITGLWNGIKATWTNIPNFFKNALSNLGNQIKGAWNGIKSTASTAWNGIKGVISGAWNGIKSDSSGGHKSVKTGMSNAWNSIKSTTSSIWGGIKGTISTSWSGINSNNTSANKTLKTNISGTWKSINRTASSEWDSIKATITGKGWSGVGSNICSGIQKGLDSGWSWLKNSVGSLATGLLDKAKSVLGIHSPSRVFRDVVGLNIGYGIGEGIGDSEGSILKTVSGVADAIANEFNAGEYKPAEVIPTAEIKGSLGNFADQITDGFTNLLDRLQAIAQAVTFTVPAIAGGVIPYNVSAYANGSQKGITDAITASNDELSSVIIQSVTNAAAAIVGAIQDYSTTTVNLDGSSLTTDIIKEINRRTRMNGKSPLIV